MAIGGGAGALARIDGGGGGSARLPIDEGAPSGGMRPVDERGKDILTKDKRFALAFAFPHRAGGLPRCAPRLGGAP